MSHWQQYIPSLHQFFWFIIAIIAIVNITKLIDFLTEALSEMKPDGTKGKGSSKRLILFMFAAGFVYGWLRSIHANTKLDPYVSTLIVVFLLLGLAILKPDQANTLLDKLKSLVNFAPDNKGDGNPAPTLKTTTTTEVNTGPAA